MITNDDGYQAPGLRALAEALKELGRVVVVAPDRERSGGGHAITAHKPLRLDPVELGPGIEAYRVNGSPADCVKLGVDALLERRPDLVFSGINSGANLGTDILYSGTVSGAMEGAIYGVPSAALSLVRGEEEDYGIAAAFAVALARVLLERGLPEGVLLNVNVPNLGPGAPVRGVRVTRLGVRRYRDMFQRRTDPRGKAYYWLAGRAVDLDEGPDTDAVAVREGYISVTPVHFDLTHHGMVQTLRGWDWSFPVPRA